MKSFRREMRITPKEEDAIIKDSVKAFKSLIEMNLKNRVEEGVGNFIQRTDLRDEDKLILHYEVSLNVSVLKSFLGRKRKGSKKPLDLEIEMD